MKKLIRILIVLIIFAGEVPAQTDLTLDKAIKIGLENNYQVLITRKDYDIAKNNNAWGTAGRYPSINVGAASTNRYDNLPGDTLIGRYETYTHQVMPNLNLRWTLFNGFSIYRTKDNLELFEKQAKQSEIIDMQNTVQDIILAYYKALLEKEKLSVSEELLELSRDRYKYVQTKKEIGAAVTFDVLQFQTAYLNDSSAYLLQQIAYENSLRNLNLLLAEKANVRYNPTDDFTAIDEDYSLDSLLAIMEENNPALRNLRLNLKVLENRVALARSEYYPSLSLNSGIDYVKKWTNPENIDVFTDYNYDYYANLTLSVNIFNGGNTNRNVENAQMEKEIGKLRIAETRHSLSNFLTNSYELYKIKKQQYEVAGVNLEAAELNLQIAREKFETGAINSFNYRDIQIAYQNAAFERLQATYNLIDAHTELMRLTGQIIEKY